MRRTAEKFFFSRFHYQISYDLLEYYSVENPEAYSGPGQTSKMKHFAKGINGVRSLTVFAQCSAKKETPTLVLSCGFCEIFNNIFLIAHLQWLLLNMEAFSTM